MTRRMAPASIAVTATLFSTLGLLAQDVRYEHDFVWPNGNYVNRQLGSVLDAQGDHLVFSTI